LTETASK